MDKALPFPISLAHPVTVCDSPDLLRTCINALTSIEPGKSKPKNHRINKALNPRLLGEA